LEDISILEIELDTLPNEINTIGIDLGLEKLYVDSNNYQALPQKHLRKSEPKIAKLQKKLEAASSLGGNLRESVGVDKKRSKKAKNLLKRKLARLHQKIARQRTDWHYIEAHRLIKNCEVIAVENLNIRNLKRKNKRVFTQHCQLLLLMLNRELTKLTKLGTYYLLP
jgi:putative transposase